MSEPQPNNPLHGMTLKQILTNLVEDYGLTGLSSRVDIRCFQNNPSMKSCLKFLRKTPWARKKIEDLYLASLKKIDSSK